MTDAGYTTRLQGLLDRWGEGDESAVEELIVHSQEQLRRMSGRMLAAKPHVGRWSQTDDVLQNALIRLHRSLMDIRPDSKRAFNGLAATQIRRELIDMARSLYGPQGHARHHKSDPGEAGPDGSARPLYEKPDPATDPKEQVAMAEFHESVGKLEGQEREVFELIFYQGMAQAEVASVLEVSERTVKRRWREARLSLKQILELETS